MSLSEINTFTPLFDHLVEQHGIIPASVYGIVFRYSKMKDGVCRASLSTLADRLHLSTRTILRALKLLVNSGYLADLTPRLRNSPHEYTVTNLLQRQKYSPVGMTESHTSASSAVTPCPSAVTSRHSPSDLKSHRAMTQSHLNKTSLRDNLTDKEENPQNSELTAQSLWDQILKELRPQLPRSEFNTWLKPCTPLSWDGSSLTLSVANKFAKAHIETNLSPHFSSLPFPLIFVLAYN